MLVYIIIACIIFLMVLAALYFYMQSKAGDESTKVNVPVELSNAMSEFEAEINSVSESVRLLEGFVGDYFMTLNEGGFRELCDISESLSSALALCKTLTLEGNYQEAEAILKYVHVTKGLGVAPEQLETYLPQSAKLLTSWRERVRGRIEIIEEKLSKASQQFQEIGAVRKRSRSPTSVILGEVRKIIFEELPESEGKKTP